jgi:hypothetical protein
MAVLRCLIGYCTSGDKPVSIEAKSGANFQPILVTFARWCTYPRFYAISKQQIVYEAILIKFSESADRKECRKELFNKQFSVIEYK